MKKILILVPYYFPGYRSGGPQQTIKNLVDTFADEASFYIYTQNHDLGIKMPYENIEIKQWIKDDNARIMYMPSNEYCGKKLKKLYKKFDIIYSCGLFEKNTIMLLIIHRYLQNKDKKIFVAPMGVFSEGAMKNKRFKKVIFFMVFKLLGFLKKITWSFSSCLEIRDAKHWIGEEGIINYIVAEDLPRNIDFDKQLLKINECKPDVSKLKIIFLSRICIKKNLDYCIEVLNNQYSKKIIFDIYGTIEDKDYWHNCRKRIKKLPKCIEVNYCGEVHSNEVINIFSDYDIFLFPTKGENFGHVIYEALAAGCIPVISNTTPWKDFDEKKCGAVIDLDNKSHFSKEIEKIANLTEGNLKELKRNACFYAKNKYWKSVNKSGYRKIFN